MERIEVNVRTGKRKVIQLTQAEIDDANARTAAEATERANAPPTRDEAIDALLAVEAVKAGAPQAVTDYVRHKTDTQARPI